MTVHVHVVDRKINSITITNDDVLALYRSIEFLIDSYVDANTVEKWHQFQADEKNKALFTLITSF